MDILNEEEVEYLNGLILLLEPSNAEDLHGLVSSYTSGGRNLKDVPYHYRVRAITILMSVGNPIALSISNKIQQYTRSWYT